MDKPYASQTFFEFCYQTMGPLLLGFGGVVLVWIMVGNVAEGYYVRKGWFKAQDTGLVIIFWPFILLWTYVFYYPVTSAYYFGEWLASESVPSVEEVIQKEPPSA